MIRSIEMMEAGTFRLGEMRPGVGQVDISQDWIATLKGRIAELDDLLSKHGSANAS